MDNETSSKINDPKFVAIADDLRSRSKPMKPVIADATLQALGLMVVRFQRLEENVVRLIQAILIQSHPKGVETLADELPFKTVVKVACSLPQDDDWERRDEVLVLLYKAFQAEEIRNGLIHSRWSAGTRRKVHADAKAGLVHKFHSYTAADIQVIADFVDRIDSAIQSITSEYRDHVYEAARKLPAYGSLRDEHGRLLTMYVNGVVDVRHLTPEELAEGSGAD